MHRVDGITCVFILAARYSRLQELNLYAGELRAIGHTVDPKWLLGDHHVHEGADKVEAAQSLCR